MEMTIYRYSETQNIFHGYSSSYLPQQLTLDLLIKPELNLGQLEHISVSPFKANLVPVNRTIIPSPTAL